MRLSQDTDCFLLQSYLPDDIALRFAALNVDNYVIDDFKQKGLFLPASLQTACHKRQIQFLAGRYCAQQALQELGIATKGCLEQTQSGPPNWPESSVGSISHNAQSVLAIAASSNYLGIGIDIETIVNFKTQRAIDNKCSNINERAVFRGYCDSLQASTLVFSAKESAFKLLYPQVKRFFSFDYVQIVAADDHRFIIELQLDLDVYQKNQRFTGYYQVFNNQVITVIYQGL